MLRLRSPNRFNVGQQRRCSARRDPGDSDPRIPNKPEFGNGATGPRAGADTIKPIMGAMQPSQCQHVDVQQVDRSRWREVICALTLTATRLKIDA